MNKKITNQILELVKQNYEMIAPAFSDTRNYIWPGLDVVIETELKKLAKDRNHEKIKVLDVGCGNGRLFNLLKNKKIVYTGVDQSKNLIAIARQKHQAAYFYQDDILNFTQKNKQKFDLILFIAVWQHVPSYELRLTLLKQIKNCLTPNGIVIITNWNLKKHAKYKKLIYKYAFLKLLGKNKMDFNDIVFDGFNKKSPRYYHAFTKRELRHLVEQADLKIKQIYADKHNIYTICNN